MRKRSDSNKSLLCESEATATNLYCAKATATNLYCAKAKRQVKMLPLIVTSYFFSVSIKKPTEIEEIKLRSLHSMKTPEFQHRAPGGCTNFEEELCDQARKKSERNYAGV
ncbi:hypothetical protein ABFY48_25550 [Lysinibacillus pakistanensis]|uniref:hypothetical protein n=1 Tax=Lysinibacillus pakistanensis TaxID=759811 RepID=UPI003D2B6224